MSLREVCKRDGTIVPFDREKINYALFRALRAVGMQDREKAGSLGDMVIKKIESLWDDNKICGVEEIQDEVEQVLMENGFYKAAKAYIIYRKQHEEMRKTKDLLGNLDSVEEYISQSDWTVKENANMTYSLQGLNNHISSKISSEYWLNRIYPQEIKDCHHDGKIHIHDLGLLGGYCVGWDLMDLLTEGFKGVPGKVECRPAKHFRTVLGQVVNFFYTLQGEAAGAQAFSNFDTLLAPFIRYDNLNEKQVRQAIQEFIYNTNIPTRVGFQTPFSNISMDLTVPSHLKEHPVIIGGESKTECYGEFQKEMNLFNRAFAEVMMEGDASGRVFTFPIPTYNITEDFDWNHEDYKPIWEMTAKYGIPYFSNFINSELSPEDVRSMCCRLRLSNKEVNRRGGGLFGASPLTGSIGVVTVNLPRLGYESKNEREFFEKLNRLLEIGAESLEIKRKIIEDLTEKGLFPYSKYYLRNIKEKTGAFWTNHFSTIGIIGMNECCENFLGRSIVSKQGSEFAKKIMEYIIDYLKNLDTESLFNLEATPAEGTSHRLAGIDRRKYPDIVVANSETEHPYYTNSTHLPVNFSEDLFEALELQEPLQMLYTGGTVFHAFLGERITADSAKNIVKKVTASFKIPYLTLSPTFSICPEHGYMAGEHFVCEKCKNEGKFQSCEVFSRIVGYIRPVQQWNDGKRAEYDNRVVYNSKKVKTSDRRLA